MKHLSISIVSILYSTCLFAQEKVYSLVEGDILVNNESFISSNMGNYSDITPYTDVATHSFTSFSQNYELKLQNFNGWEEDGGDFRVIKLYNNGNLLLEFADEEAWTKPLNKYSSNYSTLTDYCIIYPLEENVTALIFEGYTWASQAPRLTIIVIKGNKAKVVFNQSWVIEKFNAYSKGFELIIAAEYLEHDSDGDPCYDTWCPNMHKLYTTSEGLILYEKTE